MGSNYPPQKFGAAVRSLATAHGHLQERLVTAFVRFQPIVPDQDIPDLELRARYKKLVTRMTRGGADKPGPDEGLVASTCRQMSDDEAYEVACEICDLNALFEQDWEQRRKS